MTDPRPICLCMTVEELPEPYVPAVHRWCTICGATIWMALNNLDVDADPVCNACGVGIANTHGDEIVVAAMDSQKRIGITDAWARRVMQQLRERYPR